MNLEVIPFDERLRDLSWEWINTPELKNLIDPPEVSREEQLAWFDSLADRTDYVVMGLSLDGQPIGVLGLSNITDTSARYFAYIAPTEHRGKGIGRFMHDTVVEMAMARGLKKLRGEVLWRNQVSLRAHLKYGWTIVGMTIDGDEDGLVPIEYVV